MDTDMLKDIKRHFSKLGLMLFLGALICFAVQYGALFIVAKTAPATLQNGNISLIVSMLPLYVIGMPAMVLLIKRVPASHGEKYKMTVGQWLIAFGICYALMYASNLVGIYITQFIGVLKGGSVENVVMELLSGLSPWAAIPFVVIIGPIFEELIFRKMLIDRMAKYGEGIAVVTSAFLFALFHGNLNQFAYAMTLGLFWGFLYVKTRNIKYTMLMHMVINFMGSVPGMLMMNSDFFQGISALTDSDNLQATLTLISEHTVEIMVFFIYSLFIMILFITGIVLFFVNLKKMHLNVGEITIPNGKRFRTVLLNVGMLLNAAYWGIQIILQLFA